MKINNKSMQIFAVFASLMMLTVIAMPVVAAEDKYNYCDETQGPTTNITLYDLAGSEIEIINGLPYIIVETEDGYVNIPFPLSNTMDMMVDGVPITIEVDGNYLLIPTEDGVERVCISEFDIEMVGGDLMLVHEMNPAWKILFSIGVSIIFIQLAEYIHGINICWRCEGWIIAGGLVFTLYSMWVAGKIAKHKILQMSGGVFEEIYIGIIVGTVIAMNICNNPNCLLYKNRRI